MVDTMFASPQELASFLGRASIDEDRAALLLENATGLIQAETGQTLFLIEDDEVDLPGTWGSEMWLPQRPVIAVSAITVNGTPLVAGGWVVSGAGQLYRGQLPIGNAPEWDETEFAGGGGWGGPQSVIHVTYDHGFETIPKDVRALCLTAAGRAFGNPEDKSSENIGSYAYTKDGAAGVVLNDDDRKICARYRRDVMSISTAG